MQLPLFAPTSEWTPPELGSLPSWAGAKRISLDTEARDEHLRKLGPGYRRGAYMVGFSFAIEDGPKFYVPFRHQGGDNVDETQALRYLKAQADTFEGEIVGANLQYEIDSLNKEGIKFKRLKRWRDVQVAAPLVNELHLSYSLEAIATREGIPGKDVGLLNQAAREYGVDPKGGMWKLPARYVGAYAEQDVALPLQLLRRLERQIDNQDLWEVYDLESDVLPILAEMRIRGVAVDERRLELVERASLETEAKCLQEVYQLTGVRVAVGDVWRPAALAPVFHHLGIKLPSTATGKISIKKDILAGIDHPAAKAIKDAREANKIRTTFAASVRDHMTNGRIHCTFNQLRRTDDDTGDSEGAAYGRLSCVDPNMQQQPARSDFGPIWRSIYVADPGREWASLDFSQQEPKWLIHWACLCPEHLLGTAALEAARAARDQFVREPNTDTYDAFSAFSGLPRKSAKEVYLGRVYGMGGKKMAGKLGLGTKWIENRQGRRIEVADDEAQAIIDRFDNGVPYGKKMADICEGQAKKRGYIKTLSGRRCRFPVDEGGNFDWCHKALNRLIQGTSADQVKQTMVALHNESIELQLQVHDELNYSARSRREAEHVAEVMRTAVPMQLPMKVDLEMAWSWGESMLQSPKDADKLAALHKFLEGAR